MYEKTSRCNKVKMKLTNGKFPECPKDIEDRLNFYWKWFERPKRIIGHYIKTLLRDTTEKRIQREVNKHRYEIVYDTPHIIYMLLGWTKQYDEDYFYIVWNPKEGVELFSCVGGFVFLKNRLSKYEYSHAEYLWYLNNPSRKEMLKACKKRRFKLL